MWSHAQFRALEVVDLLQTTLLHPGIVSARVALVPRSTETQPVLLGLLNSAPRLQACQALWGRGRPPRASLEPPQEASSGPGGQRGPRGANGDRFWQGAPLVPPWPSAIPGASPICSASLDSVQPLRGRQRPYSVENSRSHSNSEDKPPKARSVLGWGTAREALGCCWLFISVGCAVAPTIVPSKPPKFGSVP